MICAELCLDRLDARRDLKNLARLHPVCAVSYRERATSQIVGSSTSLGEHHSNEAL